MAYLGRPASAEVSVTGSTDTFTGDGGVTFSLSRIVKDSNPSLLEVFVSNVQQQPTVTFSVSGNVLTFTSAPGVGEPIYVTYRDYPVAPVFTVPDLSITTAKIQDGAITADKIADGTIIAADVAANAITTDKIADAAVTSPKLAVLSNVTITGGNIHNVGLKVENVISSANVVTLNYANATVFTCTATEATTITPTNFPQSGVVLLKLRNGGNFTISYAANAQFAGGLAPILTSSGLDHLFLEGNTTVYTVTSILDIQED
jgi:hypothetical protein